MIRPIMPVYGVPDELVRVINDRLRELEQAVGIGEGKPGPAGPPGPAGTPGSDGEDGTGGGTDIAPPNVLGTSTAAVYYERSSHQQVFGFQGRIDLPVGDPNFAAHLKRVDVIAIGPDKAGHVIATYKGNALASTPILYKADTGIRPIAPEPDEQWSVAFQTYNENGTPAASPFTVSNLVVYAARVGTLSARPVPGSYYQDKNQGLHFEVEINATFPHNTGESEASIWIDYQKGEGWTQQNTVRVQGDTLSLRIGQPISGASGESRPGDIWVPAAGQEHWKVAMYPWWVASTTDMPPGTVFADFDPPCPSVGPCFPDDLTNAEFLPDPLSETGDLCIYAPTDSGWVWKYRRLKVTLPTLSRDPWFWHCFVSIQKGHKTTGTCSISGGTTLTKTAGADFTPAMVGWALHVGSATERVITAVGGPNQVTLNAAVPNGPAAFELWHHAPDSEGIDEHPELYLGRWHRSSPHAPFGISSDAVATIYFDADNIDFTYPLAKNPDQTENLDRDFRFRLYAVSHANDNMPSTGLPAIPFAFQTIAFKGQDHYDLTPSLKPAIHDASQINPKTLGAGLAGGDGLLPFVKADPLSPLYSDLAGLHFRAGPDYVVEEVPPGSGNYQLSQKIIDLAKAVNFDVTNFKKNGATFLINEVAVNSLIAGDALFAGQATFAYLKDGVEGGKVTISSGGLTIASTINNPLATLAVTSAGLSFVRDNFVGATFTSRNRLDLTSNGITIQSQNASLQPTAQIILNTGAPASIQIITANNSIGLTSNGITIADAYGGRVDMDSTNGLRLTRGSNVVQVSATQIKLTGLQGTLTMDSGKFELASGTSKVTLTPSQVTIVNGAFTITSGATTINIDPTNGLKVSNKQGNKTYTTDLNSGYLKNNYTDTDLGVTVTSQLTPFNLNMHSSGAGYFDVLVSNTSRNLSMTDDTGFLQIQIATGSGVFGGPGIDLRNGANLRISGSEAISSTGAIFARGTTTTAAISVNGQLCCVSDGIWQKGVQTLDHVYGGDFGINYGPGDSRNRVGATGSFVSQDGKTVTVLGGLVVGIA